MSDLHGYIHGILGKIHQEIELLILAGDIAGGEDPRSQEDWYKKNFNIFRDKNIFPDLQEIFIIPGNHDYWLERNYQNQEKLYEIFGSGVTILVDSMKKFISFSTGEEVNVWGNPRTSLHTFAFPHLSGNLDLQMIPRDRSVDILVTHEAPRLYGLPCIRDTQGEYIDDEPGNLALATTVLEVKPRYHVFGHIHYPCSCSMHNIKFMNVSQIIGYNKYNPKIYTISYEDPKSL